MFSSPHQMIAAAELVDTDGGVLFVVTDCSDNKRNFEMESETRPTQHATVIIDDVALQNSSFTTGWRVVAVIAEKILGALAGAAETPFGRPRRTEYRYALAHETRIYAAQRADARSRGSLPLSR